MTSSFSSKYSISICFLLCALSLSAVNDDNHQIPSPISTTATSKWEQSFVDGVAAVIKVNPNEKDTDNPGIKIITAEEVRKELAPFLPQIRRDSPSENVFHQKIDQVSRQILNNIIDEYLILEEARYMGIKVPESYLKNFFDGQIASQFGGDRNRYQEYLKSTEKTDRSFKKEMENQLIVDYMRSLKRKSQVEISPKKIEDYYNEHQKNFIQQPAIHLKQIMIKNPDEDKLSMIFKALNEGTPFEIVAQMYSEDEKKASGGDWGWINESDIRHEIAAIAFSLSEKTYAKTAVLIENTAFIPYVEAKRPGGMAPLQEVRKDIERKLTDELAIQAQEKWIQNLRKEASIQYLL